MALQVIPQTIPEVKLIIPDVFGDPRGFFQETYKEGAYRSAGITLSFVQDNWSRSARGTLRGLHYQWPNPQDKLVWVARGEIYDIAVDIRRNSPSFGKWVAAVLSESNHHQLFIPAGFAHGFCVLSDEADFMYKCSNTYSPPDEKGILWSDPALDIPWPIRTPILSKKDASLPLLSGKANHELPG